MLTLRPVGVCTVAMPQMDIFICLAPACGTTFDCGPVQQNLNHGNIALEVACIDIGLCQSVGRDRRIPLRGCQAAVSQPLLESQERRWLPGIVELCCDGGPGEMAGDLSAKIETWNARLAAQHWNNGPVEDDATDRSTTVSEEDMEHLAALVIYHRSHRRTETLPLLDRFSCYSMNGFCVVATGFVRRYIQQAYGRAVLWPVCITRTLPPNAAHPQPRNFILSQTGKEPHPHESTDHSDGISGPCRFAPRVLTPRQIGIFQIQPGPEQLRPNVFGNDAWIGRAQKVDRSREAKGLTGIETIRN